MNFVSNSLWTVFNDFAVAVDLSSIQEKLLTQWIKPAYFIVVALVAVLLLWKKELRALAVFAVVAVVAGLLIFFAKDIFGEGDNGILGGVKQTLTGSVLQVPYEPIPILPSV